LSFLAPLWLPGILGLNFCQSHFMGVCSAARVLAPFCDSFGTPVRRNFARLFARHAAIR
jgi:hypothetical protein